MNDSSIVVFVIAVELSSPDLTVQLFSVVGGGEENDVDLDRQNGFETVLLLPLQPWVQELQ